MPPVFPNRCVWLRVLPVSFLVPTVREMSVRLWNPTWYGRTVPRMWRFDASASADGRQTITLTPEASVFLCTVEIRDAANMSHVSAIGASMSTMAGGLLPGIGLRLLRMNASRFLFSDVGDCGQERGYRRVQRFRSLPVGTEETQACGLRRSGRQ